jgi:hypothetical protein
MSRRDRRRVGWGCKIFGENPKSGHFELRSDFCFCVPGITPNHLFFKYFHFSS